MPGPIVRHVTDERDALIAFIDQQREAFGYIVYGLTAEQLRTRPLESSEMTLGGLLTHVASCETEWVKRIAAAPAAPPTEGSVTAGSDWQMADDASPESLLAAIDAAGERTREVLRTADLDAFVPAPPAPWFAGIEGWTVRWAAQHLIEELARHAGHGDLMREAIDGATLYPLIAGKDGWPPNDYLTPWQPQSAQ